MKRAIIDTSRAELDDKVVTVKKISKTVKGGCIMRFSALVVVDGSNDHVDAGLGRADEVPEAIRKDKEATIKNLVKIPVNGSKNILRDLISKLGNAAVLLKKALKNTSVIIGDLARFALEVVGIKNIRIKSPGFNSKTNIVPTTLAGLASLKTPEEFVRLRGRSMEGIVG